MSDQWFAIVWFVGQLAIDVSMGTPSSNSPKLDPDPFGALWSCPLRAGDKSACHESRFTRLWEDLMNPLLTMVSCLPSAYVSSQFLLYPPPPSIKITNAKNLAELFLGLLQQFCVINPRELFSQKLGKFLIIQYGRNCIKYFLGNQFLGNDVILP